MIGQLNMWGKDRVQVAIDRIREFEPEEGYYLAFSGGKDSEVIKKLAQLAEVKFDAHYNLTTVDPPELVQHIKLLHSDVIIDRPTISMWRLIEKAKTPFTRMSRYCCAELKEHGGEGRFVITGVRWAESARRKNNRQLVEFDRYGSESKKAKENRQIFLNSDNDDKRMMLETCVIKGKHILNPIVDWSDSDVWEFIHLYKIPYCKLYDEGFKRLGCIGCPMGGSKGMIKQLDRYPKYKQSYLRAFDRMLKARIEAGLETTKWKTAQDVFDWWTNDY